MQAQKGTKMFFGIGKVKAAELGKLVGQWLRVKDSVKRERRVGV